MARKKKDTTVHGYKGFDSSTAFLDFFETTHGLPFEGFLIQWEMTA